MQKKVKPAIFPAHCTETRDDSARFQETTEGLSVPLLMCWRTEGTFTTARRCCGVLVILAPDTKLQTYLLTYFGQSRRRSRLRNVFACWMVSLLVANGPRSLPRTNVLRCCLSVSHQPEHSVTVLFDLETGRSHFFRNRN